MCVSHPLFMLDGILFVFIYLLIVTGVFRIKNFLSPKLIGENVD